MKIRAGGGALGQEGGALGQGAPCHSSLWETLNTSRYVQWAIPSLLYQTRRKNPLVYKGLLIVSTGKNMIDRK